MSTRQRSTVSSDAPRTRGSATRRKTATRVREQSTHPAVVERTAEVAAFIEEHGGADVFASRGIAINPRATAVAGLFAAKLLGKADDIPLEDLVTPESMTAFQRLLEDEAALAELRPTLGGMGLVWPRVQPEPDGSVIVLLLRRHSNGADEGTRKSTTHDAKVGLRLRRVEGPDDWRVEWST